MLNFEEFQEYAKNHVKEFMSGECQNAEVSLSMVEKNNGLQLHALLVKPDDSNVSPTIYLDGFYEEYKEGKDLDSLMEQIGNLAEQHQKAPDIAENIGERFRNFDEMKDKIIMNLVNVQKNRNMLVDVPHKMMEDLAIIYKVCLESEGSEIATITVRNECLDLWNIDLDTLHEIAIENSNRILPAKVRGMNDIIREMMQADMPQEIVEQMLEGMPAENQMYVITNSMGINGSASLVYSDALEKLSEKLGTDLYILPSSIHECIAISADLGTPESLADMVREVNGSQVAMAEQLSDHVYYYEAESKKITLADTCVEELGITDPSVTQEVAATRKQAARR